MGWCTAQCRMILFCVKTIVKELHNFELACLKKKKNKEKKEKHFCSLVTFWFDTFAMLFCVTRRVVGHEALENEWYIVIKAYELTVFETERIFMY